MAEIKGSTLQIGKKTFLRIHGEEMFEKVMALLDEQDRAVFTGPIWSNSWYPLDVYVHWSKTILSAIYNNDEEANLKQLVYPSVEDQFNLVYRAFLFLGSPETVVRQMKRITGVYFRGVTVESEMIAPNSARLRFTGFRQQDRIIEMSIRGWWDKMLEAMRVKDPRFEVVTSVGEGKGYGEYVVSWEKA